MDHSNRMKRFGICALLGAVLLRLSAAGVPEAVTSFLTQPNIAAFLIYLETGRDVRFSSPYGSGYLHLAESPAPARPPEPEETAPAFTGQEEVTLYNACGLSPDTAALLARPLEWDLTEDGPAVLILHTHSTESYTPSGEDYAETSRWRTLDGAYNMLSIGSRVAQLLEQAGIGTVQDRTVHDHPSYNGSYVRARASMQALLEEYPSIRLVLDLHRDASGGETQLRTLATAAGKTCAQLMLVLGTNHEAYEENLALALKLHALLEARAPGIMRPLQLRSQRFNQDLSPGALLVEVGAAGNTHAEAMAAAEQLAQAVITLAKGSR